MRLDHRVISASVFRQSYTPSLIIEAQLLECQIFLFANTLQGLHAFVLNLVLHSHELEIVKSAKKPQQSELHGDTRTDLVLHKSGKVKSARHPLVVEHSSVDIWI